MVSFAARAGVAVTFVMLITTILMTLGLLVIWKHNILTALAFFVIFGLIDVSFLSAALNKFLHGGWFPIALSGDAFALLFIFRMRNIFSISESSPYRRYVGNYHDVPYITRYIASTGAKALQLYGYVLEEAAR